jgi:hypothetical protein
VVINRGEPDKEALLGKTLNCWLEDEEMFDEEEGNDDGDDDGDDDARPASVECGDLWSGDDVEFFSDCKELWRNDGENQEAGHDSPAASADATDVGVESCVPANAHGICGENNFSTIDGSFSLLDVVCSIALETVELRRLSRKPTRTHWGIMFLNLQLRPQRPQKYREKKKQALQYRGKTLPENGSDGSGFGGETAVLSFPTLCLFENEIFL